MRKTLEQFPNRSPLIIIEHIKDLIQDKVVCDLGCGGGDILVAMQKYAAGVFGIELTKVRCNKAESQGINVIKGNYREITVPYADVYYTWPGLKASVFIINLFINKLSTSSILILSCRPCHLDELLSLLTEKHLNFLYETRTFPRTNNHDTKWHLLIFKHK
jgi:hypothetical protein